jgi:hypothetical protein
MYNRIEVELRGVQQALQASCTVSTAFRSSEEPELGDDPTQLRRLVDATEVHIHQAQDEKYQATTNLKQAQEEMVEQFRVAQKEKEDLQAKIQEERV